MRKTRFQLILPVDYQNEWYAISNNWQFGHENWFCAKKHLKIAFFGGHVLELPVEGPGRQVNFWVCPEKFWVIIFKVAMWKVGGTKIERLQARYIFVSSRDT